MSSTVCVWLMSEKYNVYMYILKLYKNLNTDLIVILFYFSLSPSIFFSLSPLSAMDFHLDLSMVNLHNGQ